MKVVYPPGTKFTAEGYPRYWSTEYGCWMYPVLWNQRTGAPIYSLMPKQWELLKLTPLMRPKGTPGPTRIGFGGSAGGSKSFCARAVAAVAAHLWPGSVTVIIRETEKQVKDNHVTWFIREVPADLYDINRQDLEVRWKQTGSLTHFRYLRQESDLSNFQGPSYDVMIFEESTLLKWELIEWLIGNRNRANVDGSTPFALFPTNPGGPGHYHFKRLFIDRRFDPEKNERAEDHAFLPAKLSDNYVLLKRDPEYKAKLDTLPEPYRSWFRDGDFAAGAGTAFPQLDRSRHFIDFFIPPPHWTVFGAFDWGYQHPFSFGYYTVNEDGRVFKCDTIEGRFLSDNDIADRILDTLRERGLDPARLSYVAAGHDCWADMKARKEHGETTAERFHAKGLPLVHANISRIAGAKQLREYLSWERRGIDGGDGEPGVYFMRTPGNERCFTCLETRTPDKTNPEDVQKTNADLHGEGGDDSYDETRYALLSRPARPKSLVHQATVSAFAPAVLAHEADQTRRVVTPKTMQETGVIHPEFGLIE